MIRAPEQMAYFPSFCSDSDDDLESDEEDEKDEDNDEDYDDEIDETAEKRYLVWASVDNYYPISLFLILLYLRHYNYTWHKKCSRNNKYLFESEDSTLCNVAIQISVY